MKMILKVTTVVGLSFCVLTSMKFHKTQAVLPVADSTDNLFATGTQPQVLSSQFTFTEGASVDKKGNVFFTDQPNNKIWEYDTDGKLSVFLDNAHRANGMYFDNKGNLVTCADETGELLSISPKKELKVLVKDFEGHQFNGPNDLWIAPNGDMYISDPYFKRNYWTHGKSDINGEKLYYLKKGSNKLVLADVDVVKPNGIVGTPDGKYLYVSDGKTYKYTINKDGSLSNKTVFITQGSDGMTLDNQGNLYVTGKGVMIYNPQGKRIAQIPIKESWTANLCFGGKNKDVLFITASKSVYTFQMKVKGIE